MQYRSPRVTLKSKHLPEGIYELLVGHYATGNKRLHVMKDNETLHIVTLDLKPTAEQYRIEPGELFVQTWGDCEGLADSLVRIGALIDTGKSCPLPEDQTKHARVCRLGIAFVEFTAGPHSTSSMVKTGTFPEGMTKQELLARIAGTFGGRFEVFEHNRFRYIAYTD